MGIQNFTQEFLSKETLKNDKLKQKFKWFQPETKKKKEKKILSLFWVTNRKFSQETHHNNEQTQQPKYLKYNILGIQNFPGKSRFSIQTNTKKIINQIKVLFQKTQAISTGHTSKPMDLQALISQTQKKSSSFHNIITKSTKG